MYEVAPVRLLRTIRRLARAGRVIVIEHAQMAMVERDVLPDDIGSALCNARQCWQQENARILVQGPDMVGEELSLVVEVRADLIVVTLFRQGDE